MRALRLLAGLLLAAGLACATPPQASAAQGKIRVFFLTGGGYHNFTEYPALLTRLLEATGDFQVTVTQDRSLLNAAELKKYDVVLFDTQGGSVTPDKKSDLDITPTQEKALTDFVKRGGGWAGIHSASDSYKDGKLYINMLGGVFKGHGNEEFEVKIVEQDHPVVRGLKSFRLHDETYTHTYDNAAPISVLARRTTDNEPFVWVRDYGKGRVFYTGMGHEAMVWENRSFQTIVVRGLYWAAWHTPRPLPSGTFKLK